MFRTFRRQHEARFLPGLQTLRLDGLPPAIAWARFSALSNRAGGLDVQVRKRSRAAFMDYPAAMNVATGNVIVHRDNARGAAAPGARGSAI